MNSIEHIIFTIAVIGCFIAIWFIPLKKADRASFIFLLTQFFSWILGLIVVEFVLLDYPVREMAKANATSFIFEFFILPVITVYFILHYPFDRPLKLRILYYVAFGSGFTLIEVILERYTKVIEYHSWKWYWTWISMMMLFYIVKTIYKWFYRIKRVFSL